MTKTTGLIPTSQSSLYDTFGLDIVRPAEYDDEGTCIREMEPVEWIDLGSFPLDEEGDTLDMDPRNDGAVRDMLDKAAAAVGYGIRWGTYSETTTWEFHEVEVYAL